MSKLLIISPQTGLGNRLRAIASAMVLADKLSRTVYQCWIPETQNSPSVYDRNMQALNFTDLFDSGIDLIPGGTTIDICFSEILPYDYWYDKQNDAQIRYAVPKIYAVNPNILSYCTEDVILLETSKTVILPGFEADWENLMSAKLSTFVPKAEYLSRKAIVHFDVGIFMRRNELSLQFPEILDSANDIRTWLQERVDELQGLTDPNILVISDDFAFRDEVLVGFNPGVFTVYKEDCMTLGGLQSWEQTFVAFLTLADCDRIYGTLLSSFTETAALFGNKEYRTILR